VVDNPLRSSYDLGHDTVSHLQSRDTSDGDRGMVSSDMAALRCSGISHWPSTRALQRTFLFLLFREIFYVSGKCRASVGVRVTRVITSRLWRSSFGTVLYPATWNHDLNFVGSGRAVFDSMRFEHARKEKLATTGLSEALTPDCQLSVRSRLRGRRGCQLLTQARWRLRMVSYPNSSAAHTRTQRHTQEGAAARAREQPTEAG
jgi:hypothetical protein